MQSAIWITWEHQLRNKSLASKLGVTLHSIEVHRSKPRRYLASVTKTLQILRKTRPRVVIAQNPSVVLTCVLTLLRPLYRYALVCDAHFGGVVAYNRNPILQWLLDSCNRRADLVIVTNDGHAEHILRIGGEPFICEDPLPELSQYAAGHASEDKSVLFICSFDVDEPYRTVFEAADELMREGFTLSVSGDHTKVAIDPKQHQSVRFLGFCPENEFYEQLFRSQVVVDLTTQENCLLCGAYEAMAAEKPLVTSDTKTLRDYFTHGTVYTIHTKESIASAIRKAYEQSTRLTKDIIVWKRTAIAENDRRVESLRARIDKLGQHEV